MGTISDQDLSVFKDIGGVHDFNPEELTRLHQIAQEVKKILEASKKRDQAKFAKR